MVGSYASLTRVLRSLMHKPWHQMEITCLPWCQEVIQWKGETEEQMMIIEWGFSMNFCNRSCMDKRLCSIWFRSKRTWSNVYTILKYFVYSRSIAFTTYNSGYGCFMVYFLLCHTELKYTTYFCFLVSKFQLILHHCMQTFPLISAEFSL